MVNQHVAKTLASLARYFVAAEHFRGFLSSLSFFSSLLVKISFWVLFFVTLLIQAQNQ